MRAANVEPLARRRFLRLAAAGGLGGLLLACGSSRDGDEPRAANAPAAPAGRATATPTPTATPQAASEATPVALPAGLPPQLREPGPPWPAGRQELLLMGGTEWETPLIAQHSGELGPSVLVLGGVHGNEPGGWLAAEEIAEWVPARGTLAVVPRANVLATQVLERTLPELGDLNRLYPGSYTAELPMARMAAQIVNAASYFAVELVLDLHESWAFYVERGQNGGTAFLGQTITSGPGPDREAFAEPLASAFNARIEVERDHLIPRDRRSFAGGVPRGVPAEVWDWQTGWQPGRGGSSLSLGSFVEGVTPVLIEMGQQNQPLSRRAELHQLITRIALERLEML